MPQPLLADETGRPPGAPPFPPTVEERIRAELARRPKGKPPRTKHRDGERPHFANRLIFEASPYLQQHAHNPVNWHAWGDAAFEEARRAGKPVFLSVGYATCHWCHVMEEESFEDVEIAHFLNEHYIAIKVDREERPDVDAVYMAAVQALSGRGGWPMSVWLDANRRPFFAGTYVPARDGDRGSARGFLSLLQELAHVFQADPLRVAGAAASISAAIGNALAGDADPAPLVGSGVLEAAQAFYRQAYDPQFGGVRGAPKFPSSLPVRLLLRRYARTADATALTMAQHTLEMMSAGGMHDQLGGGFHRYSTDERWLVPHFEKMLYDNALLALAYAEAWQVTRRRDFARMLRTTLDYVLREMTAPSGGFYSATDADSEGEEGTFFVWRADQIRELLGPQAQRFMRYYGVTPGGNFEGRSVLHVPNPDEDEWEALHDARETLRAARERRPRPLLDDKILIAWNGLMISALALGGRILGDDRYVTAAAAAADFVLAGARNGDRLQRSWKDGRSSGPGFLEDDAFFVAGLLDLYEATFERRRLAAAIELAEGTQRLFADERRGGWFRTAADHEHLIAREKPNYDGAEPSGASVAARSALRLHAITLDDRWRKIAEGGFASQAATLAQQPAALSELLLALDLSSSGAAAQVVLVWHQNDRPPADLLEALRRTFLPNHVLLGAAEGADMEALARLAPACSGKVTVAGRPAAYVCELGACRLPTTDVATLEAQLAALAPISLP